ncbi:MAG: dihydrofolate reductase family protein [bacterium]
MVSEFSAIVPDPERVRAKLGATGRPYVTLKAAATLDGKIATREGESKWITGEAARRHAHRLRAGHAAILVGLGTVRADNPRLTVRLAGGDTAGGDAPSAVSALRSPVRVVLDSRAGIDPDALVLAQDGARRIVVTGAEAPAGKVAALRGRGVEVITCESARPMAGAFLPALRNSGLDTVLVEGGAEVHGHFIAEREADELFLYLAGRLIGDRDAPGWCGILNIPSLAEAPRVTMTQPVTLGGDVLLHGFFGKAGFLE